MLANARKSSEINGLIGLRIREARLSVGLTMQELGEGIGVSYQQVQKYEKAINRVSAATLCHIARVIDFPVSYFYGEDWNGETGSVSYETQVLTLTRAVKCIGDAKTRMAVAKLIEELAS